MAYEAEIAALRAAIGTGALEIESIVNGVRKRVKYDSVDGLQTRITLLESLQSDAIGKKPTRVSVASFSRGR